MEYDFFFFNDTATTEIYTLSLHDALPICAGRRRPCPPTWPAAQERASRGRSRARSRSTGRGRARRRPAGGRRARRAARSEEHTSELQSRQYLVCRLLLEKKNHLTAYDYYY